MPPSSTPRSIRACDSCRRRKVKCDASEACSNCRISGFSCQYTAVPQRRGPKVPRTASHTSRQSTPNVETPESTVLPGQSPAHVELLWLRSPASTEHPLPTSGSSRPQLTLPADGIARPGVGSDAPSAASSALEIRDDLLKFIRSALPSLSALEIADNCIDLYLQYMFPTAPMIHEPTMRATAARFFSDPAGADLFSTLTQQEELAHMRTFALLTGFIASVASVMPESLLSYRQVLATPCLRASRALLHAIEDADVEQPNSASIVIRILQATAIEHITGKTALSYYVLGQATALIRTMRLYSEEALKCHEVVEAQILRNVFWQMFAADKASVCLGSRPPLLHELLFDEELSVRPSAEQFTPLLDTKTPSYGAVFEERMLLGFQFLPRLWSIAASLLSDMKAHVRGRLDTTKTWLIQAYMDFLRIMDHLPAWLQASNVIISPEDGEVVQFQKTAFWVQRCTVLVTFQCLRLVILEQSIQGKVWDVMGLNDHFLTLPMAKIEIVSDFIKTLDDIPFIFIQIKGEPTVARIRWVGSVLLELMDTITNDTIKERAEHHFSRLLNVLAKLDPKSSDVLADLTGLRVM